MSKHDVEFHRNGAGPSPGERRLRLEWRRSLKMARDAHSYVRGATEDFYEWLREMPPGILPAGPPLWICGDLHVGNIGPLADAEGDVAIQIRDLDQATVGEPAHDLVRLGLSLATAARSSDLSGVTTLRMLDEVQRGYVEALAGDAPEGPGRDAGEAVAAVLATSMRRRWDHLALERLDHVEPKIPLGKRFWALSDEERDAVAGLVASEGVTELVRGWGGAEEGPDLAVIDAAYWRKGCSSLGKLRYAVLVGLGARKKHRRYHLLDIKEAVASVAPAAPGADVPRDHAERVVTGARALSPNLGERMLATTLLGRPVVVRELMPQDLKLEIDRLTPDEAVGAARFLAGVVGRAHGRQLSETERERWIGAVSKHPAGGAEEPWLWSAIVDLMGRQASAYLRHCRTHASRFQETARG